VGGIAGVYLSVPVVAVLRTAWLDSLGIRNSSTADPARNGQKRDKP